MFKLFVKKTKNKTEDESLNVVSTFVIVKKLISDVIEDIDQNNIHPEIELESLGLDSIKFLNILLGLEDVLNMDLENIVEQIDLSEIYTVQDVVNLVDDLKRSKG